MSYYDLKVAYEWVDSYRRLLNSMGEETQGARHARRALEHLNELLVENGEDDRLNLFCDACGNRYDGDNFCMPSACQWEK